MERVLLAFPYLEGGKLHRSFLELPVTRGLSRKKHLTFQQCRKCVEPTRDITIRRAECLDSSRTDRCSVLRRVSYGRLIMLL
jgi:hypothetical protein